MSALAEHILVVDAEPELARGYQLVLERAGYRVTCAHRGDEALRVARETTPDLVLLDVVLPDASGVDICRQLKAMPELAAVSVINVSGQRASPEAEVEGLEAGADGYLTKPLPPRALRAHVAALLRLRRTQKALRESAEHHRALVAELKESNRRLEGYNRLKAEFVANMSHELRTPLTAIIGFAQLARQRPGDVDGADALERILRNGRHLLALIDDVLDVSKIEAGRLSLHREHFDVVQAVQSAFVELESLAVQKGLAYRLHVRDAFPLALTDPTRLRQVVVNLLSNAIKFTPRGVVEAELALERTGWLSFAVTDTGVGIQAPDLDVIFERFRQVDGSATRAAGGTGLGLYIVRQITELLGGRISVSSEPHVGSRFEVRLPLIAPDHPPAPAPVAMTSPATPAADPSEAPEPGAPTVLIVEDDADAAAILANAAAAAGYRVRLAADGITGLRLAKSLLPAVVVLDVMMPGMDGWRVLQALRADPATADLPVVICSIVDNRALGYQMGASDYLVKPVDPSRLAAALTNVDLRKRADEGYVLVVDDEQSIRRLLATALRDAGFSVSAVASGAAALRLAAVHPPRAIVTDLIMPGMSGFEFIARLRSTPETAHTPIVVVTGRDLTSEDRRLLSGQIADVIRKGDLLLTDLEPHLRTTLETLGVRPAHGDRPGH